MKLNEVRANVHVTNKGKGNRVNISDREVYVALNKHTVEHGGRYRAALMFNNACMLSRYGRIEIAFIKDCKRLYFLPADDRGYKVTRNSDTKNIIQISGYEELNAAIEPISRTARALIYDAECKEYYIQL